MVIPLPFIEPIVPFEDLDLESPGPFFKCAIALSDLPGLLLRTDVTADPERSFVIGTDEVFSRDPAA
jgi:hypothetical protein